MTEDGRAALTPDELATLEGLLGKLEGQSALLPWPLFRFINEVVATPNVDLLVEDDAGRVLLAWREDPFGTGWHVPGSIIRHRETIADRIDLCAADEFGCDLDVSDRPFAVIQIFDPRGHSVSLCFKARPGGMPGRTIVTEAQSPQPGDLRWFAKMPDNLYPSHEIYREVVSESDPAATGIPVYIQQVQSRETPPTAPGGTIRSDVSLTDGD